MKAQNQFPEEMKVSTTLTFESRTRLLPSITTLSSLVYYTLSSLCQIGIFEHRLMTHTAPYELQVQCCNAVLPLGISELQAGRFVPDNCDFLFGVSLDPSSLSAVTSMPLAVLTLSHL